MVQKLCIIVYYWVALCCLILSLLWLVGREYPEYRFHFLKYPRLEYLDLGFWTPDVARRTDYVDEFAYSLANLHLAASAQAFVGTLSSNWCVMVSRQASHV
jgi:hypothetical protein